jgi:hypothetical protein
MGTLSWLKGRRPAELDEDEFKDEIRAHFAIGAWRAARTSPLHALRHQ